MGTTALFRYRSAPLAKFVPLLFASSHAAKQSFTIWSSSSSFILATRLGSSVFHPLNCHFRQTVPATVPSLEYFSFILLRITSATATRPSWVSPRASCQIVMTARAVSEISLILLKKQSHHRANDSYPNCPLIPPLRRGPILK